MSGTLSKPYDWLRVYPRSLLELDDIPLFGRMLPFPWNELAEGLGGELNLVDLKIENTNSQWLEEDQLLENLGDDLIPLNLGITGLEGSITWVMPQDHLKFLVSKLLNANEEELDQEYLDTFYRYLGYTVVNKIGAVNWEKSIPLHILNRSELPSGAAFCLDIRASWSDHVLLGRLIISPELQQSWKKQFADRSLQTPQLKAPYSERIDATVHLEAGNTGLTLKEWKQVKAGDFILLDSCGINPGNTGVISMTVKGVPLFIADLADGKLTIKERSQYQEVKATMADEEEEFDEEFEEFEEEEEEGEEEEEEAEEEAAAPEAEEPAPEAQPVKAERVGDETPLVSPSEVPLAVVIEVGRLRMSFQKIMDLQPGNVLDLNIKPEDGVDLTINGKRVAKAELLRVGETLGLRILDVS